MTRREWMEGGGKTCANMSFQSIPTRDKDDPPPKTLLFTAVQAIFSLFFCMNMTSFVDTNMIWEHLVVRKNNANNVNLYIVYSIISMPLMLR